MTCRVLQAMSGRAYGGTELYFERLVTVLKRAGVEQQAFIGRNEARAKRLRKIGIEAVEAPYRSKLDFKTKRMFRYELKHFAPDVVITWMPEASALCPRGGFSHIGRLGEHFDRRAYASCDHLIAPCGSRIDRAVSGGWLRSNTDVISSMPHTGEVKAINRGLLFTPNTAQLILTTGRLNANKGIDVLMEAISRVSGTYLWIAGDGPDRKNLEKYALDLGIKPRVRFLGWRDDVPDLIATCDVFVCSSRDEELGDVVVEAWSQAAPVIATDSAGPGSLIRHEENGILVPIDDANAIASAIKKVIRDKSFAESLSEGGRSTFRNNYAAERLTPKYLALFNRLRSGWLQRTAP